MSSLLFYLDAFWIFLSETKEFLVFVLLPFDGTKSNLKSCFHIVAGEEPCDSVHDPLPPSVIVLLQDVNGRTLGEGQLVLFVSRVVVDGGHTLDEVLRDPVRNARDAALKKYWFEHKKNYDRLNQTFWKLFRGD